MVSQISSTDHSILYFLYSKNTQNFLKFIYWYFNLNDPLKSETATPPPKVEVKLP